MNVYIVDFMNEKKYNAVFFLIVVQKYLIVI